MDARLGLEVSGNFGAQDGVPAQIVAASNVRHDGDVAVGAGAQQQPGSQPREARPDIPPGVEAMPGEVELRLRRLVELLQPKARLDLVEHAPVDDVELRKRLAAGADLVHAGLIFGAPRIREGKPVERISEWLEDFFRLAGDAVAP